jgi:hypothetical protein
MSAALFKFYVDNIIRGRQQEIQQMEYNNILITLLFAGNNYCLKGKSSENDKLHSISFKI